MTRKIALEIICFLLILLFVYTAVSKFINFEGFRLYVVTQTPLIRPIASFAALAIPISELIAVVLLLTPRYRKIGLYISFVLMAAFTAYVVYALYLVPKTPCSCGGILHLMGWRQHLIFNSIFTVAAFIAIRIHKEGERDSYESKKIQFS